MTRKDFVLIAEVVSEIGNEVIRQSVAQEFARRLRQTNDHFDREQFLKACNVSPSGL